MAARLKNISEILEASGEQNLSSIIVESQDKDPSNLVIDSNLARKDILNTDFIENKNTNSRSLHLNFSINKQSFEIPEDFCQNEIL